MTSFTPLGEAAVLARFGDGGDAVATTAAAWRRARDAALPGVVDLVPAPPTLLVRFDPATVSRGDLEPALAALFDGVETAVSGPAAHHVVAVAYGGAAGPDLDEAARRLDLTPGALVEMHAASRYTVSSTGFAPGFVYLDGLDPRLRLPRRDSPRLRVPAGSVAMAELYSGIYGAGTGGGWWLLGRTEAATFDPAADPPSPFALGDTVTFTAAT